jgi:hypothetical protein
MASITVTTASPVIYTSSGSESSKLPTPMTVVAIPGSGGSLSVEYQVTSGGSWIAWPSGTVVAKTVNVLNGPVFALRFTAYHVNGTVEIGL